MCRDEKKKSGPSIGNRTGAYYAEDRPLPSRWETHPAVSYADILIVVLCPGRYYGVSRRRRSAADIGKNGEKKKNVKFIHT